MTARIRDAWAVLRGRRLHLYRRVDGTFYQSTRQRRCGDVRFLPRFTAAVGGGAGGGAGSGGAWFYPSGKGLIQPDVAHR